MSVSVCRPVGSERGCICVSPEQALSVGGALQALVLAQLKGWSQKTLTSEQQSLVGRSVTFWSRMGAECDSHLGKADRMGTALVSPGVH